MSATRSQRSRARWVWGAVAWLVMAHAGAAEMPSNEHLRQQAARRRELLKTSLVDCYLPASVDTRHGGYLETLDAQGRFAPDAEKFLVMQGRQLWFFSTLSLEGIEREKALAAAKSGFEFIRRHTGPLGKPADDLKKEWWVQAEALVAMLELHRLTGNADYLSRFDETLAFIARHHVAPEGGWYATRNADGSPLRNNRNSMWQGAYHGGRALIVSAKLLEEIAGK